MGGRQLCAQSTKVVVDAAATSLSPRPLLLLLRQLGLRLCDGVGPRLADGLLARGLARGLTGH